VLGISEDAYPTFPIQLSKNRIEEGAGIATVAGSRAAIEGTWSVRPRRPADAAPGATIGGDSRDRTGSLRLAKPALSQLSYIPERYGAEERAPEERRDLVELGRTRKNDWWA
jgi:hypothetical protein